MRSLWPLNFKALRLWGLWSLRLYSFTDIGLLGLWALGPLGFRHLDALGPLGFKAFVRKGLLGAFGPRAWRFKPNRPPDFYCRLIEFFLLF